MDFKLVAWFIGMGIVGGFVYTFLGMQVCITKKCALKLFEFVKDETNLWYPSACKKYLSKVIRTNRIILLVIALLVFFIVPLIGVFGYFAGYGFKWLTTRGACGPTLPNLEETLAIFMRFAKDGKENEFESRVCTAAEKLAAVKHLV